MNKRKNCIKYFSVFLLLVLSLFLCGVCSANQIETDSIQTQQLNELRAVLSEQQTELSLLQAELEMLEMPSNELIESLREAKIQLAKSKTYLLGVETELEDAKLSMNELSESLTALKEALANERAEAKKQLREMKRERNALLGVLALCITCMG